MKIVISIFTLLVLNLASGFAVVFNPILEEASREYNSSGPINMAQRTMSLYSAVQEPSSDILLFGKGDAYSLEKYGARVVTIAGNYFTAFVPLKSLNDIRGESRVEYLQLSPRLTRNMDKAGLFVRSDITSAVGYKGDGVIIGVIDTGIDISHPDFTTENGLSRIIYLWDQVYTYKDKTTRPKQFDYGREWTKKDIDAGRCTEYDAGLHGTFTTGIAAGNGKASDGKFKGISPGANIIFVKLVEDTSYLLDAIDYILGKSKELGKPCVINISFGSHYGSHTEQDPFNLAVDALLNKHGLEGHVIVWSAGNEGDRSIHNVCQISSSADQVLSFMHNDVKNLAMDFWYPSGSVSVALINPSGVTNIGFTNTAAFTVASNNNIILTSSDYAGEKRLSVDIATNINGFWQIVFKQSTNTVKVDGYIWKDSSLSVFVGANYSNTISTLACQRYGIAVGAVVTKISDTNLGYSVFYSGNVEDIADFSSQGMSRDNKNKPDITAPGAIIIAPLSAGTNSRTSYYTHMNGTSMAAPIVTGAIAQLLEKEPYLTPDGVRTRLILDARGTLYKGNPGVYDHRFGYGVVNLSYFPNLDASKASLDVTVKNNVMNSGEEKDSKFLVLFRSNSSQIGKNVQVKIYDKNGNLIKRYDPYLITGIEVKDYVWDGKDQFDRKVQPGLYFAFVFVDTVSSRYPLLVVR